MEKSTTSIIWKTSRALNDEIEENILSGCELSGES